VSAGYARRVERRRSRPTEHGADRANTPVALDVIVIVDVANVMGSRPDGWWRDRKAAATRLLTALGQVTGVDTTGPDGRELRIARVVAVLEGAARGAPGAIRGAPGLVRLTEVSESMTSAVGASKHDPTDSPIVEVVEAERDGDTAIVDVAEKLMSALAVSPEITDRVDGVLVVTADRGLRRRLPPDAIVAGPEWVNRLIDR
jgi:hypothetical protein